MREIEKLNEHKEKLMREMNQYASDANLHITFTPSDINKKFTTSMAKKLLEDNTLDHMYNTDNNITNSTLNKIHNIQLEKEERKTKRVKSKAKRNKKGCECKW